MKLSKNANKEGRSWANAIHTSFFVETFMEDGTLMSMTNNVIAIANTPSQKTSRRAFSVDSDMIWLLVSL